MDRMVGNANRILGMLKRTFESRDPELWKDLYVSIVRPHLGVYSAYLRSMQCWNPYLQGDIEKIESVQRRATRISTGFEKIDEDRLEKA